MDWEQINLDEWDFGGNKIIRETFETLNEYVGKYGKRTASLAQIGDFSELYSLLPEDTEDDEKCIGSPLVEFASICDLNITGKNSTITHIPSSKKYKIRFAGFKHCYIERYCLKLKSKGFTVVRVDQKTSGPNPERFLYKIYSPIEGNLEELKLFSETTLSNNTSCIWMEFDETKSFITIGLSNLDTYTGKTSIFEYKINYSHSTETYDELERAITIINPCETILITSLSEKEIKDLVKFLKITNYQVINHSESVRVKNCYKQTYQKKILEKFYDFETFSVFSENFYNYNIATQSFCYLLDFIYEYNPNLVKKLKEPLFENNGYQVLLANHSLIQLNIIDDHKHTGKYSSVAKMFNEAITPMGQRKLFSSLVNPITNIEDLNSQYDIVDHIKSNFNKYKPIFNHLRKIKDLQKFSRQIILQKIRPFVVTTIAEGLQASKEVFLALDNEIKEYLTYKKSLIKIEDLDTLLNFIEKSFDLKACKDVRTLTGFNKKIIMPGVNEELDDLLKSHMESFDIIEAIRKTLDSIIKNFTNKETEFIKIYEQPKKGQSLSITKTRSLILMDAINAYEDKKIKITYKSSYDDEVKVFKLNLNNISLETHSSNCLFIVSKEINDVLVNLNELKTEVNELNEKIYFKLIRKIENKYFDILDKVSDFITEIDLALCKSQLALKYNYFRPIIRDDADGGSFVNSKNLRHPLIEAINTEEFYIPNDFGLNKNGLLIYGTNATGKSSAIKSIGISIILAQSGFFVPSSEFIYYPYKKIFTRIIGNDNIFEGSSTFTVEILELKSILKLCDPYSLILGDELCSSTELESAEAICTYGYMEMGRSNASFMFATHLHSIVKFDEIKELVNTEKIKIQHMTVLYNKEIDKLVYNRKLRDGPGPGIYGIEVCRSLGLEPKFIEGCNKIRNKYHPETSSILERKTSKYSKEIIRETCQICKEEISTETHHIHKQSIADQNGFITIDGMTFHKNHPRNLMVLCQKCHLNEHKDDK